MMRFSTLLAEKTGAMCLVTGESLGQVASQTVESMHFTGSCTDLPVFRPLVGMNKEEIIAIAKAIDTFETSNLPYADCCVLFSPEHPLIHPDLRKMKLSYAHLDVEGLLLDALEKTEQVRARGRSSNQDAADFSFDALAAVDLSEDDLSPDDLSLDDLSLDVLSDVDFSDDPSLDFSPWIRRCRR